MSNLNFTWWGRDLSYFHHMYNCTWLNERAVELPIAFAFRTGRSDNGLEIGNVLSHYDVTGHHVVDRYEAAPGVENADVFDISGSYDWIIAISTLEHVRWDEEPKDIGGSLAAIQHLRSLLAPGGEMLVTVPTGAHPGLDVAIADDFTGASRACTFTRSEDDLQVWVQDPEIKISPYGDRTDWASTVWIGEFQ
jgi:SAM-dependent methyltransferase